MYNVKNKVQNKEIHSLSKNQYNKNINRKNPTMLNILKKRKDDIDDNPRQKITSQLRDIPDSWKKDGAPLTVKLKFKQLPIALASNYGHTNDNDIYTSNLEFPGFDFVQANSENSNKLMANKLWEFMNLRPDTKVWFFAGRGKSGSGKTSTLVYLNLKGKGKNKDGVLVEIVKQMRPAKISITAIEIGSEEAEKEEREKNKDIQWKNKEEEKSQFPWIEYPNDWKLCSDDGDVGCDSPDVKSYWRWVKAKEFAVTDKVNTAIFKFDSSTGDWLSKREQPKTKQVSPGSTVTHTKKKGFSSSAGTGLVGIGEIHGDSTSFKEAIVNIFEKARSCLYNRK